MKTPSAMEGFLVVGLEKYFYFANVAFHSQSFMEQETVKAVAKATDAVAKLAQTALKGMGVFANHLLEFDSRKVERMSQAKAKQEELEIISRAKARAKAKIIEFEAEAEIQTRTLKRLAYKEKRRENNLKEVLSQSKNELVSSDDEVAEEPVNEDWAFRFFEIVQDISDKEIQAIWAKILAGEVRKPRSFSLRTIETLRNLSSEEAKVFQLAVKMSFDNEYLILPGNISSLDEFGLGYDKIIMLKDAQLIGGSNSDNKSYAGKQDKDVFLTLRGKSEDLTLRVKTDKRFKINVVNFTKAGSELSKITQVKTDKTYFTRIKKIMIERGYEIIPQSS